LSPIIDEKMLRKNDLPPAIISDIMKLMGIYDKVADLKPVDANIIKKEIDEVLHDIEEQAEKKRAEDELLKKPDEYTHKMFDAEKLAELVAHLPEDGNLNVSQIYAVKRAVKYVMKDLAQDPALAPDTMNKKHLRDTNIAPDTIKELTKLKNIFDIMCDDKKKKSSTIQGLLREAKNDIENDAHKIRVEADLKQDPSEYKHLKRDAVKLKNFADDLPEKSAKTNADINYEGKYVVKSVMADLAKNDDVEPHSVDIDHLRSAEIEPKIIDIVLRLKNVYEQLDTWKPLEVNDLQPEILEIEKEIDDLAEKKMIAEAELQEGDEYNKKMADAKKIDDLLRNLPESGKTDDYQNYEIKKTIKDVIEDLCGRTDIDISKLTRFTLNKMDLTDSEIDEILRLKKIYDELKIGVPTDVEHIKEELQEVKEGQTQSYLNYRRCN